MKQLIFSLIFSLTFAQNIYSQETFLPLGANENHLIERVESLSGYLYPSIKSSSKPISRAAAMDLLVLYEDYNQMQIEKRENAIDDYNSQRAQSISGEWGKQTINNDNSILSRKPFFNFFYKTQANFIQFNNDEYFISINPILNLQVGGDNKSNTYSFINTRGAEIRAKLWNRIGVYTALTENQERFPHYAHNATSKWKRAYPGYDFHTGGSGTKPFDGMRATAYLNVPIFKKHIKSTLGYGSHFIGDGHRSLWLSNFGAPSTFLKVEYQHQKWHYQNLFLELMPDYYGSLDRIIPRKYAAMHYLNYQIHPKWTIGLFESTIFNSNNQFNPKFLMPILGVNYALANAAGHSTHLGLNVKGIAANGVTIYAQALAKNFGALTSNSWKNQLAAQLGAKYYDAFSIKNLDIQVEANVIRPFMYTSDNGITNYSHYNMPLAHPLENGFREFIFKTQYQPLPKLTINLAAFYAQRSQNIEENDNGASIFEDNSTRKSDNGFSFLSNNSYQQVYGNINGSYELKTNLFLDAGIRYYRESAANLNAYLGIRLNAARRIYDWF